MRVNPRTLRNTQSCGIAELAAMALNKGDTPVANVITAKQ